MIKRSSYVTTANASQVRLQLMRKVLGWPFYMETSTTAGPATMVSSVAAVLHEVRTT
jgi:hypothetical protein